MATAGELAMFFRPYTEEIKMVRVEENNLAALLGPLAAIPANVGNVVVAPYVLRYVPATATRTVVSPHAHRLVNHLLECWQPHPLLTPIPTTGPVLITMSWADGPLELPRVKTVQALVTRCLEEMSMEDAQELTLMFSSPFPHIVG